MSTDPKPAPAGDLPPRAAVEALKAITGADLRALAGADLSALHDNAYWVYHAAGRELDRRRQLDVVTERPADWPGGVPGVDPTSDAEVDRALRAELRCADCGCRGRVGADGVCPGCTPPAAPAAGGAS